MIMRILMMLVKMMVDDALHLVTILDIIFIFVQAQNDNDEKYNDDVVTGLVTTPLISSSSLLTLSLNVLFVQENGGLRHVMEDLNRVF